MHKRSCTESTRVFAKGHVPITEPVTIGSSDDAEIQEALREAYEKSDFRGKQHYICALHDVHAVRLR